VQGCETALYRALDLGKADLATLLLQYGADVDVECPHGVTILNKVHNSVRQTDRQTRAARSVVHRNKDETV